jgi:Domain of unknown function (DUF3854)
MYSNPNLKPNSQQPSTREIHTGHAPYIRSIPTSDERYSHVEEFQRSAIPDRLTLANVQWVEGKAAIELLASEAVANVQRVSNYATNPAQKILARYEFMEAGGWYAVGTTLDGSPASIPYVKPLNPREATEYKGFGIAPKIKTVKYETPQGMEAAPLLPWVDPETAQELYDRYQIAPLDGESFWQCWKRYCLPIALTEGLKKALALIAHGIPAVALRGITQWHRKGEETVHPAIAQLLTPGQKVLIFFDQDEKASTQKNVRTQILKLGSALTKAGCKPHVALWNGTTGKGIDDALFHIQDGAQTWLDAVLSDAIDLATYKRDSRILNALENLKRLNSLNYPVERATQGEYLPTLPELKPRVINVLSANMNAGKTTRIGTDWVKPSNAFNLVLSPTNATGEQTAFDWELPHIHAYGTDADSQAALWADAVHRGGIVMCAESLHRVPGWLWSKPVNLILDEANQVIHNLTEGDTLGNRYADILERFTAAARHALQTGAIVLSEDGLPDRAVNFMRSISGAETVRVFTHKKESAPWDVTLNRGQASRYRSQFLEKVKAGNRIIYVTSSRREGERIERAIGKLAPARRVVRIDSDTNEGGRFTGFFEQPDQWLQENQPDILILSPSAKSGVSIEGNVSVENAYFSAVWGYFPVLGTDTHSQLLGRYRPPVPRIVFCPDFILSSADESLLSPRAIKRRLGLNARAIGAVYGVGELLTASDDDAELKGTIQTAVLDYLASATAAIGNQKLIAHIALTQKLKSAGHNVTCEVLKKEPAMVATWKAITEEIEREEATAIATAAIDPHHTIEWARKQLQGLDVSKADRILARKVIYRDDFPGVMFDCPEECYQALTRDYGAMARGVRLQAKAENLDGAKRDDEAAVKAILSGKVKQLHHLPRGYVQALLIAQSGVLDLLNGEIYSNADPRCQRVKEWAVKFSGEISYWLRLQINDGQTPIEICHKLLKKLGLERDKTDRPGAVQTVDRKGKRGANSERFRVDLYFDPIRAKLLEAARRKHSESVPSICNKENLFIQIDETDLKPPEIERSPALKLASNPEHHFQSADFNQALGGRTENAPRTA